VGCGLPLYFIITKINLHFSGGHIFIFHHLSGGHVFVFYIKYGKKKCFEFHYLEKEKLKTKVSKDV
jgi:hypothetical protein